MGFNTFIVAFSTFTLGVAAGFVGVFLTLRKRALLSDALAHGALPGLCLAFLFGVTFFGQGRNLVWLLIGATISGLLSTFVLQFLVSSSRIKEDAALASVLSVFFGFGIMLLSIIQNMGTGEEGGLNHFIYGQTAAMGIADAYLMFAIATLVIIVCSILHKEFGLLCFNSEYASSLGMKVGVLDVILMILTTIVIVVGLQAVGMLLVVALLVIPASAARFWTHNLRLMVFLSAFFGGLSGLIGSLLSSSLPDLPAGGIIVLVAGSLFLVSLMMGAASGLLRHLYIKQVSNPIC